MSKNELKQLKPLSQSILNFLLPFEDNDFYPIIELIKEQDDAVVIEALEELSDNNLAEFKNYTNQFDNQTEEGEVTKLKKEIIKGRKVSVS